MTTGRPWVNAYDKGVSANLIYPDYCIDDFLQDQSRKRPEKKVIIYGKRNITYKQLEQDSTNLARQLLKKGIKSRDVIAICLPNSIEFVIAFFGVLKAGGIVAAMNPAFPVKELETQIKETGARAFISTPSKTREVHSIISTETNFLLVTVDDAEGSDNDGFERFNDLLIPVKHILQEQRPSNPAVLQFSGGTTGKPKVAIGTHRNLVANATQFRHWLVNFEDGKETFLVAIPLYHVYGLVLGLVLGISMGATLVFTEQPGNIEEILNLTRQYAISYFPAIPSIFRLIIQHPVVLSGDFSFSTIKACISGSAPLPVSVREEFEKKTGAYLVEGYGLSEAPTATHCNPIRGEKRDGSIGLPLPDVECRIVEIDEPHHEVAPGKEGELWVKGPQVMVGYWNEPIETAKALQDGWLRTGDVARMDPEGYFFLSGRLKELIKVHGMQVWPTEVEAVISKHPAILECAVAGIPDPVSGECVKAWLVLKPQKSISLEELRFFCKENLAGYKIPRQIELRNTLPRSAVGKILRRVLVEDHIANK